MQRPFWVALTLGASSIVGALFREPFGDFVYDIFTNLFPEGQRPAQIIAMSLRTYWPWALAAVGAVVVMAVYGQSRWFWRRPPSLEPSAAPATPLTITALHGSTVVYCRLRCFSCAPSG